MQVRIVDQAFRSHWAVVQRWAQGSTMQKKSHVCGSFGAGAVFDQQQTVLAEHIPCDLLRQESYSSPPTKSIQCCMSHTLDSVQLCCAVLFHVCSCSLCHHWSHLWCRHCLHFASPLQSAALASGVPANDGHHAHQCTGGSQPYWRLPYEAGEWVSCSQTGSGRHTTRACQGNMLEPLGRSVQLDVLAGIALMVCNWWHWLLHHLRQASILRCMGYLRVVLLPDI